jgi:hypothetical protein
MPPTKGQSNDRKQSFSEWKLDSREEQKHSGHMVLSLLRVCGEQACLSQNQNRDGREFPRRPDAEKAALSLRVNINSAVRLLETVTELIAHYKKHEL